MELTTTPEIMSERESMSFDVVIVGAGVAGLSVAIRLKQLSLENGHEISVVVLEKAVEVGAHVLSGAIIDPVGLDQLLPDWRENAAPLATKVCEEQLSLLTKTASIAVPSLFIPRLMKHQNCYVGSLGALTRWLGEQAASMGVEIYPGFAASELLYDEDGALKGVATPDQGLDSNNQPTDAFMRGMELLGRYTLIAEGARGYLAQQLIQQFDLDKGRSSAKYGLGIKELWQVPADLHRPGRVEHMVGWPLSSKATGGGFLYHYGDNLVSIGLVVHADYTNPALSPFDLFQTFKTHPSIRSLLEDGKRIGYGARAISEGGLQSVPRLAFAGGALIGCSAGLMNLPRLKGSHNAILSAMLAAQSCFEALQEGRSNDELTDYQNRFDDSEIARELQLVANAKPLLERFGSIVGGGIGLFNLWRRQLFGGKGPALARIRQSGRPVDRATLETSENQAAVSEFYADDSLTFDRASSLKLAGVFHEENQPAHLVFKDPAQQLQNLQRFGLEPAQYYCPAGVYELRHDEQKQPYIHISAANCLHCKMCDIKDPADNIIWHMPPSGGPTYVDM
jgi:electron-transferring-flavoprotein dehydrogenase